MKRPTVHLSVRAIQPLVAGLESLGVPAEPILRAAELEPELASPRPEEEQAPPHPDPPHRSSRSTLAIG